MHRAISIVAGVLGVLASAVPVKRLSAQSADTPACKLMSVAEVQKITGITKYERAWGMGPGEAVGGGSSCAYQEPVTSLERLPMIGFSLIPGKGWTERRRTMQLPPGCKRVPVAGVGDDAFYEECPSKTTKKRIEPLYVKIGSNDIVVEMDIRPPVNEASARNATVALAKAVAAKLKK
ncbi:MAG TPA: hypothetical protein VGP95_00775 [Gemmatimonadaceae bacterium]|nr:hypothetical protein [Gemmatimonadaceae bacterium]